MVYKLGRNDLCLCDSGLKYKKCCLHEHEKRGIKIKGVRADSSSLQNTGYLKAMEDIDKELRLKKAGYHLKHIHTEFKGKRVRALFSKVFLRPLKETFHEFLMHVFKITLGEDWRKKQATILVEEQGFIFKAYNEYVEWCKSHASKKILARTGRYAGVPDGYTLWLVSLAYDVYSLQNCDKLPDRILNRLRDNNQFQGARYEIAIAGLFARLGFEIVFVDDDEFARLGKKPYEFDAIDHETGITIAVEVKSRKRQGVMGNGGEFFEEKAVRGDVNRLFSDALKKDVGAQPYLIFVDVNCLEDYGTDHPDEKEWVGGVQKLVDRKLVESGSKKTKQAGVFFTNFAPHYYEHNKPKPISFLWHGYKKPAHTLPTSLIRKIFVGMQGYGKVPDLDLA